MKTVVIQKQVHSSNASFSSGDKIVKIITTAKKLDFKPVVGEYISSKKFPMLDDERVKEVWGDKEFIGVAVESDEYFCRRSREDGKGIFEDGYDKTPEFKERVDSYIQNGWVIQMDIPAQNAYWERETRRDEIKDKKNGLVLWMRYEKRKGHPEYFQGGFSDEVFNSPSLKNYVERGIGVYGWIGNTSARVPEHDKVIEAGLRKRGLSAEAMYNWISSGDGRHFAESLEGFSIKKQISIIKKYLNSIFNLCLIYGSSNHEGSLKSSVEIRDDYESQGILLPENKSGYDQSGHLKMMALMFAADIKAKGKKLPEHLEKMLPSLMDEVKKQKWKK